ncbi:MAG: hypothetical protein LBP63_05700 [Prevotellaceae bacterium]|nr:hypothetical protein [Prevotellaceae bacterium]
MNYTGNGQCHTLYDTATTQSVIASVSEAIHKRLQVFLFVLKSSEFTRKRRLKKSCYFFSSAAINFCFDRNLRASR